MTLSFSLTPDAESRLCERARASGLTPEEYARRVLEETVAAPSNGGVQAPPLLSSSEIERRLASLRECPAMREAVSHPVDDSRESIYRGRGE